MPMPMPPPGPSPESNHQQHHKPLPTPRTLLTSLFNSLSISPPASNSNPNPNPKPNLKPLYTLNPPSTNPLKPLSKAQRSLLVTLHVIFPPPTLLQALDLLDRGLVTRVYVSPSCIPRGSTHQNIPGAESESMLQNENQDQESIKEKPETETQNIQGKRDSGERKHQKPRARERERERENIIYQVHSAQERPRRRSKRPDDGGLVYTVRLSAWQCSCAAFAFAAFPREDMDLSHSDVDLDLDVDVDSDGDVHDGEWEFGGLSFDGRETEREKGGPPAVCKHLLACLLAERWEGVFGGFVKEREVGRGEGAGIGGA